MYTSQPIKKNKMLIDTLKTNYNEQHLDCVLFYQLCGATEMLYDCSEPFMSHIILLSNTE